MDHLQLILRAMSFGSLCPLTVATKPDGDTASETTDKDEKPAAKQTVEKKEKK